MFDTLTFLVLLLGVNCFASYINGYHYIHYKNHSTLSFVASLASLFAAIIALNRILEILR